MSSTTMSRRAAVASSGGMARSRSSVTAAWLDCRETLPVSMALKVGERTAANSRVAELGGRAAIIIDLAASAASRSNTSPAPSPSPAHTASAASSVQPPEKIDKRCNNRRSGSLSNS